MILIPLVALVGLSTLISAAPAPAPAVPALVERTTNTDLLQVLYGIGNATQDIPSECSSACQNWASAVSGCISTYQSAGDSTTSELALEYCLCATLTGQEPTDGPQCVNCVLADTSLSQTTFQAIADAYNSAGDACVADGFISQTGSETRSGVATTTSAAFTPANPQTTSTPIAAAPSSALGGGVGAGGGTTTVATPLAATTTTSKAASAAVTTATATAKGSAGRSEVSFVGTLLAAAVFAKFLM
ncbi:hypothetical protein T439DRAFT_354066 [Meredithblackwellia eburnea MCA 4105]